MFTFKSIAHFFAHALQAIKKDAPQVEADLQKVEASKPLVEGVTAVAGGSAVIPVEDAAYAALGAIAAALSADGDAAAAKLQNAGIDVVAIQKTQAVLTQVPHVVPVAKSL